MMAAEAERMAVAESIKVAWAMDPRGPVAFLIGEVDAACETDIDRVLDCARDEQALTVDLADVTFLDVAGLHLLERLAAGPNVELREPSPAVHRLLARLGRRLPVPGAQS